MGLRPLTERQWIEVDHNREAELNQKRELLRTVRSTVVATLPGSQGAQEELEAQVTSNLKAFHPEVTWTPIDDSDPIVRGSSLIQEDCCILENLENSWILTAACVCFPSRWTLTEKIGRDLLGIHQPVPGYADALNQPVNSFFDRLQPTTPKWRLNWTILDTEELHLPTESSHRRQELLGNLGDLTFRVERQTLRKLEKTGAVVFTIRNYTTPLSTLCADEHLRDSLLTTLQSVSPEITFYKGWISLLQPLTEWLSRT